MKGDPWNRRRTCLCCDLCEQEIAWGARYWYLNGCCVCGDCFLEFAELELAPYRCIRGKERIE